MFNITGYEAVFEKHDLTGELLAHLGKAAQSKTFGFYSASSVVGFESTFLTQVQKHIQIHVQDKDLASALKYKLKNVIFEIYHTNLAKKHAVDYKTINQTSVKSFAIPNQRVFHEDVTPCLEIIKLKIENYDLKQYILAYNPSNKLTKLVLSSEPNSSFFQKQLLSDLIKEKNAPRKSKSILKTAFKPWVIEELMSNLNLCLYDMAFGFVDASANAVFHQIENLTAEPISLSPKSVLLDNISALEGQYVSEASYFLQTLKYAAEKFDVPQIDRINTVLLTLQENPAHPQICIDRANGLTLEEIGLKNGCTRERVRQIESKYKWLLNIEIHDIDWTNAAIMQLANDAKTLPSNDAIQTHDAFLASALRFHYLEAESSLQESEKQKIRRTPCKFTDDERVQLAKALDFDSDSEVLNAKKWNLPKLIKELHAFAAEIGKPGMMPMQHDMRDHGRRGLGGVVGRFGGQSKVAKLAGLIYQGQMVNEDGGKTFWTEDKMRSFLYEVAEKVGRPNYMPAMLECRKYAPNPKTIVANLMRSGTKNETISWGEVAKKYDLTFDNESQPRSKAYWTEERIKEFVFEVAAKENNVGFMPTIVQCQKYAPNPKTIASVIMRSNSQIKLGSWFEVAQKYGLKFEKGANGKATLKFIKSFVNALGEQLQYLTPSEIYVLFEQQGFTKHSKSITQPSAFEKLVGAIQSGNLPQEEIKRWVGGEKGDLVEALLSPDTTSIEDAFASVGRDLNKTSNKAKHQNPNDDDYLEDVEQALPVPRVLNTLKSLDKATMLIDQTTSDKEAIDFLIAKAAGKLWTQCFRDENTALAEAKQFSGNQYAQAARDAFLEEYTRSKQLPLPVGYDFRDNAGKLRQPKLMQKLIAYRVQKLERVLNLSGTGTGKTLSAVLASRVIGAQMTVISCPNATVDGWQSTIKNAFSNSEVQTKTWFPMWQTKVKPRYLVLNHEMFRDSNIGAMKAFMTEHAIDFIVIDELHQVKQRDEANESQRRKLMTALITDLPPLRLKPRVLGMTATPIINNLQEGKSLIELVSGLEHNEIDVKVNVQNCMKVYQKFTTMGFRMMPTYRDDRLAKIHPIDCTPFLDDLLALGHKPHPQAVEAVLVRSRWPKIKQCLRPKTVIFTDYVKDIVDFLRQSVLDAGFTVGLYTGNDKESTELAFENMLDQFKFGSTEVLIASTRTLATGVDGLQHVCNNVIFATLPWTNTDYEQAVGRFDREGFQFDTLSVHVPKTYAVLSDGQEWSWCESKLARIENKKGIARAAVDGEIPDTTQQLTPEKATGYWMGWLKRLSDEGLNEIERKEIKVPLDETDAQVASTRLANYGDFARLNARWNNSHSSATHKRLQENPEEWCYYHTRMQEHEKDWQLVPRQQCIEHLRSNIPKNSLVADFGCGQAQLAEALKGLHTVYSLDHVAINQTVTACDMSDSGLESDSLNAAVFSLSLMGSNVKDYLLEAYRTLMVGGQLLIYQPAAGNDREKFIKGLEKIGFATTKEGQEYKWHYIWAIKVGKQLDVTAEVSF